MRLTMRKRISAESNLRSKTIVGSGVSDNIPTKWKGKPMSQEYDSYEFCDNEAVKEKIAEDLAEELGREPTWLEIHDVFWGNQMMTLNDFMSKQMGDETK
jgi:hypothetical protein